MPESKDPEDVSGSHAASRHFLKDTADELQQLREREHELPLGRLGFEIKMSVQK